MWQNFNVLRRSGLGQGQVSVRLHIPYVHWVKARYPRHLKNRAGWIHWDEENKRSDCTGSADSAVIRVIRVSTVWGSYAANLTANGTAAAIYMICVMYIMCIQGGRMPQYGKRYITTSSISCVRPYLQEYTVNSSMFVRDLFGEFHDHLKWQK